MGVSVKLNAPWSMETEAGLHPTGRLIPVQGSPLDLTQPRPVAEMALDALYVTEAPFRVEIRYPRRGAQLVWSASEECAHCVVYSPPDAAFFCVEPQNSSADCHNLHARGFAAEANLQVVPPGATQRGWMALQWAWAPVAVPDTCEAHPKA